MRLLPRPSPSAGPQRGSIPVATALLLPLLLGFAGLAGDSGNLYLAKRRMQTAADAGAISAALELRRQAGVADVVAAGKRDAALNGFAASGTRVDTPPVSGPHAARPGYAEVRLAHAVPTHFMGLFGINTVQVTARAVAGARPDATCFLALNSKNVADAMTVTGAGEIAGEHCSIFVNGSVPDTLSASGAMTIRADSIGVQSPAYRHDGGSAFLPAPQVRQAARQDPLAGLQAPAGGATQANGTLNGAGTHALRPGVYPGGIHLSGGMTVNFQPGIYVLQGGFTVDGAVNLNGSGVAFYTQGPVTITGSGVLKLSAPETGAMAGILFYGDRARVTGKNAITGGISGELAGTLYFPSSALDLVGSGGLKGQPYLMLIADTLSFTGGMLTEFNKPVYNGAYQGTRVALAE